MGRIMYKLTPIALGLSAAGLLYAAEPKAPGGLEPLEDVPPPPARVQSGKTLEPEALEPEITIIQRKGAKVEEYRIHGRLYMIKVIPVIGKPYYLLDQDGDGQMETKMSEIYSNFIVPSWVLFSW